VLHKKWSFLFWSCTQVTFDSLEGLSDRSGGC
jgi:hypothetical protein